MNIYKVYVVLHEIMIDGIKGIYSTEEVAEEFKAQLIKDNPNIEACGPLVIKPVILDLPTIVGGT